MRIKTLLALGIFFMAASFTQNAYSQISVPVYFNATSLDYNTIWIEDVVVNMQTTQSGVTSNISYPYYGYDQMTPGEQNLGDLVSTTTPTGIQNAFIVQILPTSYVTVYNNSSTTKKGSISLTFNDGFGISGAAVTIPAHATVSIPFPTTGNTKSFTSATYGDGIADNIVIWYNDTLHQ